MNKTFKTVALVALCAASGLSRAAVEVEKVEISIERSSDTGFYYQTHLPVLGWPVGIPVAPFATYAWWMAKYGMIASAAVGTFNPASKFAIPAQVVGAPLAIGLIQTLYIMTNVMAMRSDDLGSLQAGTALFFATITYPYWSSYVNQYIYNKLPSTADIVNPVYAKIQGKKKVETEIAEVVEVAQ